MDKEAQAEFDDAVRLDPSAKQEADPLRAIKLAR